MIGWKKSLFSLKSRKNWLSYRDNIFTIPENFLHKTVNLLAERPNALNGLDIPVLGGEDNRITNSNKYILLASNLQQKIRNDSLVFSPVL